MLKTFAFIGSVFGLLAVAMGAFGAHAMQSRLEPRLLDVWETAARYQMYHALALFAAAWLVGRTESAWPVVGGWLFVAGIVIFCGSLYGLAASGLDWLGAITPIGGLAMMGGWLCCAVAATRLA